MPTITFDQVSKAYGGTKVITDFTATIPDNSFLVLLGPSGCGKSTLLRMLAGLTELSSGEIRFDETNVNRLSPKKRNIAFVFQSYALYPHMSVRANIAFPLVMDAFRWWHHIPVLGGLARKAIRRRPEVRDRVEEVAGMLELTAYLDRKPKALSGGQRQRVALARALVREPALYLLDEPLSNLDAKLRAQMRTEISALHARVQKTFVYVTHDQVEAMTMGTQIIVLNDGVVQQFGTPAEIYAEPANTFVARFIGAPPMNLIPVDVDAGSVSAAGTELPLPPAVHNRVASHGRSRLIAGIRAEQVTFRSPQEGSEGALLARVVLIEHLGAEVVVGFKIGDREDAHEVGEAATRGLHYARFPGDSSLAVGELCEVLFDPEAIKWFDADTGVRVRV